MRDRYYEGETFEEYMESVEKNRELLRAIYDRVEVPEDATRRAREIGGTWYLLALSEDWCGDAVNLLPVIARFVEEVPGFDLRVLRRDQNPDIMNEHLTGGRSRSIPVVIVLDDGFEERGWWGPRPEEIQEWVVRHLDTPSRERYATVRRWYARDRGSTTLDELLSVIEDASSIATDAAERSA